MCETAAATIRANRRSVVRDDRAGFGIDVQYQRATIREIKFNFSPHVTLAVAWRAKFDNKIGRYLGPLLFVDRQRLQTLGTNVRHIGHERRRSIRIDVQPNAELRADVSATPRPIAD